MSVNDDVSLGESSPSESRCDNCCGWERACFQCRYPYHYELIPDEYLHQVTSLEYLAMQPLEVMRMNPRNGRLVAQTRYRNVVGQNPPLANALASAANYLYRERCCFNERSELEVILSIYLEALKYGTKTQFSHDYKKIAMVLLIKLRRDEEAFSMLEALWLWPTRPFDGCTWLRSRSSCYDEIDIPDELDLEEATYLELIKSRIVLVMREDLNGLNAFLCWQPLLVPVKPVLEEFLGTDRLASQETILERLKPRDSDEEQTHNQRLMTKVYPDTYWEIFVELKEELARFYARF